MVAFASTVTSSASMVTEFLPKRPFLEVSTIITPFWRSSFDGSTPFRSSEFVPSQKVPVCVLNSFRVFCPVCNSSACAVVALAVRMLKPSNSAKPERDRFHSATVKAGAKNEV